MEKIRYYCELPGDFWEDGSFMQLLKENMNPLRDENGRLQYDTMRKFDQVHPELAVLDPGEACAPMLLALRAQRLPLFDAAASMGCTCNVILAPAHTQAHVHCRQAV